MSSLVPNDSSHSKELLEANADVANLRLENEALSNMYLKRIEELNGEVEELNKKIEDSENRVNTFAEKIKERDTEIASNSRNKFACLQLHRQQLASKTKILLDQQDRAEKTKRKNTCLC